MTDRQKGTTVEPVVQSLLADFRQAGTPSKIVVIALFAFFIWTACREFEGYEFYVDEDTGSYSINDHCVHIHLYSWWGLRDKFYDVQMRRVRGEDYNVWHVREKEAKDSDWGELFHFGQYGETLLAIGF